MKKTTISLEKFKEFGELTLVDLERWYEVLFDELDYLSSVSSSFVENEEDLLQFAADGGFSSVYGCALELLTSYGEDRGKAALFHSLGLVSAKEHGLYLDTVNASITFLQHFLLSSAIWKEV